MEKIVHYRFRETYIKGKFAGFFTILEKDGAVKDYFRWSRDLRGDFNDRHEWFLERHYYFDRGKEWCEIVVEEINHLIKNGYELSKKAKEQYEFWLAKYNELQEKIQKQIEENRKRYEEYLEREKAKEQARAETKYVLFCDKYGCEVKNCNGCSRAMHDWCKPALLKVKA